jgi:hypothetical protein
MYSILQNHITIDLIRTKTKSGSKSARSWFWDQRRRMSHLANNQNMTESLATTVSKEQSLSQFLIENCNQGEEVFVRGQYQNSLNNNSEYLINKVLTW